MKNVNRNNINSRSSSLKKVESKTKITKHLKSACLELWRAPTRSGLRAEIQPGPPWSQGRWCVRCRWVEYDQLRHLSRLRVQSKRRYRRLWRSTLHRRWAGWVQAGRFSHIHSLLLMILLESWWFYPKSRRWAWKVFDRLSQSSPEPPPEVLTKD